MKVEYTNGISNLDLFFGRRNVVRVRVMPRVQKIKQLSVHVGPVFLSDVNLSKSPLLLSQRINLQVPEMNSAWWFGGSQAKQKSWLKTIAVCDSQTIKKVTSGLTTNRNANSAKNVFLKDVVKATGNQSDNTIRGCKTTKPAKLMIFRLFQGNSLPQVI